MPTSTGWPRGKREWQEAVNLADLMLCVDALRQYGLIEGGPAIDVARCRALLKAGAVGGFRPVKADVDAALAAIASESRAAAGHV